MDPAEIRFIRKAYIKKREARRFLKKSARPPSCESPLKLKRQLVRLLAIQNEFYEPGLALYAPYRFLLNSNKLYD